MQIKYEITIEDALAFNRYHFAYSPAYRRMKWRVIILMTVVLVVGSLIMPGNDGRSPVVIFAVGIVSSGLFAAIFLWLLPRMTDRQVRNLLKEGANKGMIGEHELEIDEQGIVERTEFNESRQSWMGVKRIERTDDHAFIYISAIAAHLIPKDTATVGEFEPFVERARQYWLAANPDAANKS